MVEVKQERILWAPGHKYGRPCMCKGFPGEKRMKYIQPERPISFRPMKLFSPPDVKMPAGTTYNLSYEAFDPKLFRTCRGIPTVTKENLISAGDFTTDTTHRMSYNAWPDYKKDKAIVPKDHKLTGDGPMQEVTTHRHDYTVKPIDSSGKIVQLSQLGFSEAPMEGNSTMSMSYRCPDYNRFEPAPSFKPQMRYLPPQSPLEANTIQKLSYLPWEPKPKEDLPWTKKECYFAPKEPLDVGTIYNGSFVAPGKLIEDDGGHCKGCYCLFPNECFETVTSKPKKPNVCPSTYDNDKDPPRPPPLNNLFSCAAYWPYRMIDGRRGDGM